jgi:cytoskeletal protein CcmA (bactofilin family)
LVNASWNGVTGLTLGVNVTWNGITISQANITGITIPFSNVTGAIDTSNPATFRNGILLINSNLTFINSSMTLVNATSLNTNGSITPSIDNIFNLGNATNRWYNLFISNSSTLGTVVSGVWQGTPISQSFLGGITIPLVNASWNGVTGLTLGVNVTWNGITIGQANITGITIPAANVTGKDYSHWVSQANITGITIPLVNASWNGVTGLTLGVNVTWNGITIGQANITGITIPASNVTNGTFSTGTGLVFTFPNNLTVSGNITASNITAKILCSNIVGGSQSDYCNIAPTSGIGGPIPASNITNGTFSTANGLVFTFPNNLTVTGNLSIDRLASGWVPQSQITGITIPLTNASWNGVTGLTFGTNVTFSGLTGLTLGVNVTWNGITIGQSNITGITIPASNVTGKDYSHWVSQANITGITIPLVNASWNGVTGLTLGVNVTWGGITNLPLTNTTWNGVTGLTLGVNVTWSGITISQANITGITIPLVNASWNGVTGLTFGTNVTFNGLTNLALGTNVTWTGITIGQSNITGITIPANNVTNGTFETKNYVFPENVTIGKTLTATNLSGSILCSNIVGGSDSDYCSDATSSVQVPWSVSGTNVYNDTAGVNVGIGTASPSSKLVVVGDLNVSTGRIVTSHNISIGLGVSALGVDAVAIGSSANASGEDSIALGYYATASNNTAITLGYYATASGYASTALGDHASASGNSATALGYLATASGYASTALGREATASGNSATALGDYATASNISATAVGDTATALGDYSTALGAYAIAFDYYSTAIGPYAWAQGINSTALGPNTNAFAANSILIGIGNSEDDTLNNSIANSFIVGYGNTPLFFINLSSGDVGINTTSPTSSLHVVGTANITGQVALDATKCTSGQVLSTTAGGVVQCVTDATAAANTGWSVSETNVYNDTAGVNVGIGTATPLAKLQINSSSPNGTLLVQNTTGSALLFVNGTSGNVGIGTASPTASLQIQTSDTGIYSLVVNQGIRITQGAYGTGFNLNLGGAGTIAWNAQGVSQVLLNGATGNFVVTPNTGNTIIAAGNVGIGTTTPAARLEVNGSANVLALNVNNTLYVNTTTSNVGVGTNAPTEKLTVAGNTSIAGNLTASGHVAIGNNASIDSGAPFDWNLGWNYSNVFAVQETFTNLTANNLYEGINNFIQLEPDNNTGALVMGINSEIYVPTYNNKNITGGIMGIANVPMVYGSGNVANLFGDYTWASFGSNGTATSVYGTASWASNEYNGTVTNVYGGYFQGYSGGNSTTTNLYGLYANVYNYGPYTPTVTNGYGLYIGSASKAAAGTWTNNYGLYIGDQSAVGSTNSYNLYSAGANSKNYFAGNVSIGTTTADQKLNVGGSANITGNLTASGHVAIGRNATVDDKPIFPQFGLTYGSDGGINITSSSILTLAETVTNISTFYFNGIQNSIDVNPSNNSAGGVYGIFTYIMDRASNNKNISWLSGMTTSVYHNSHTNMSSIKGADFSAYNMGNGTVSSVWGLSVYTGTGNTIIDNGSSVPSSAKVNNLYGIYSYVSSTAGTTITNAYNTYIETTYGAGTITNNYGLYINDQSGAGSTNSYNLYSAGANSKNYFAGNVTVVGNLTASNLTGSILCNQIVGGSDADYCADGGGGFEGVQGLELGVNVTWDGITGLALTNTTWNGVTISQANITGITIPLVNASWNGVTGLTLGVNVTWGGITNLPLTNTTWNGVTGLAFGTNVTFNGLSSLVLGTNVTWSGVTGLTFGTNVTFNGLSSLVLGTNVTWSGVTIGQSNITGITIPASNVTGKDYSHLVSQANITGITIPASNVTGKDYSLLVSQANITGITLPQANITGITIPASNVTNNTFPTGAFTFQGNITSKQQNNVANNTWQIFYDTTGTCKTKMGYNGTHFVITSC